MFPTNQWYAAAWDRDVGNTPFGRTVCGEQIVFYRKPDRSVAALEDCCPHRLLPLSNGFVRGERIVCGYHGLEFEETGTCACIPGQETIPATTAIKAYPVAERHRFIWVWIGDPGQADEAAIPDVHWCDDPAWAFDGGTYHIKCDFRLLIDNLMDLSHETFVHGGSIGQHEITESPIDTTWTDSTVTVTRWMRNVTPPPFWAHNFKTAAPVDRWQICHFSLPSTVNIDVGVAHAGTGAPEGDRAQGISAWVIGLMTPETETTTHYLWGFARDFEIGDAGLTARIREAQGRVFAEDEDVLAAQQRNIAKRPDRRLMTLAIDAGGAQARRILNRATQPG